MRKSYLVTLGHSFLMTMVSAGSLCQAGSWTYEPFVSAAFSYDDNIRLAPSNEETSVGGQLEVGVELANESEANRTVVRPTVRLSKYASQGDLDTNELFLIFGTRFKGERSTLSLDAELNRDSSITSEPQDSGRVAVNTQRNMVAVRPNWRYQISPRNTIDLGGAIERIRWPDDKDDNLNEYNNNEVRIGFSRALSPLLALKSNLYQRNFDSIETGFEAETTGLEFGLSRKFNERTQGSISLGGWGTDLINNEKKESITGTSAQLEMKHQAALSAINATLTRDLVPSSIGEVREDTRLRVVAEFRATEKMSWGIDTSWQQSSTAGKLVTALDRTYYQVTPYLAWRLNRQLRLKSSFQRVHQDDDQARSQDRNKFQVSLEYRKDKQLLY